MILFTGASGFLGRNIFPSIKKLYGVVDTVGLMKNDTYYLNLANNVPSFNSSYDIVIHAAGKAHTMPNSKDEEQQFFDINFQGTKNLCKGLEKIGLPKAFVFISTVAVYGNEKGTNITEEQKLNGNSPYALSKIQAENFLKDWCKKNNIVLGILRPSLIAGKNPPGNLGAMIKGIKSGRYLRIGDGSTRKSILMAEDIARIIPRLIEVGGVYNVCDNHHPSFAELEEIISHQLSKSIPRSIPIWLAKLLASTGDVIGNKFPINSDKLEKIIQPLTFSNEKAKRELDWEPMDVLQNFRIK